MKRIKWDKQLKNIFLGTLLTLTISSSDLMAATGKVTFLRGKASAVSNGKTVQLKKGSEVAENTQVLTEDKSVVKVKLPDNSQLTIGPKSDIKIERFKSPSEPSLVSVAGGLLRSKVPKSDNKDTKMLIKTNSAVMGVRGTELQTIYNPKNNVASTITYTGDVSMAKLPDNPSPKAMEAVLKSGVSIKAGQVSVTDMSKGFKITPPTKISPVQFNSLKRNDSFNQSKNKSADSNKKVVPPGLSMKKAAPAASNLEKALGVEAAPSTAEVSTSTPAPKVAGSPAAGGYVDLKTGLYVPPPKGSTFDPNTGVYVPNESVGKIDPDTGEFLTTEGTELNDKGEFTDSSTGEVKADMPTVTETINSDGPSEHMEPVVSRSQDPLESPIENPFDPTNNAPVNQVGDIGESAVQDAIETVVKTHATLTVKINLE